MLISSQRLHVRKIDNLIPSPLINKVVVLASGRGGLHSSVLLLLLSRMRRFSASSEEPSQEHQSNLSHIHPRELTCAHPTHLFEAVLPKWIWKIPQTECWKSNFNKELPLRSYVVITNLDWKTAIDFFLQIEWCLAEDFKTAFIELAFFFWDGGYRFQEAKTPADVATWLRKCVNQAAKIKSAEMLVRGQISSTEPPQVSIRQIFLLRRARCFRRNFCWGVKKQG